ASEANALVVQPDGKIVVAGGSAYASGENDTTSDYFALVRYRANGSLDPRFGKRGIVTTPFGTGDGRAFAVVLQRDGKLVAAGESDPGGVALVRYNPDGSLDRSFGSGGKVQTIIGDYSYSDARALVLQPDGKLVAAGYGSGPL